MKAFFQYYGSKMRLARHYGPPRSNVVIEPFAGSASYSVYWGVERAMLYDLDETICELWDWLIHGSENDLLALPDVIRDEDHLNSLHKHGQILIRRWFHALSNINRKMPFDTYRRKINGNWKHFRHYRPNPNVWSRRIKYRIAKQKQGIVKWTIDRLSYTDIPDSLGHWHVDPPYSSKSGDGYVYNNKSIDYKHLAEWCRNRQGEIDVCEMEGAEWLPFWTLRQAANSAGRRYREVVWSNRPDPQQELLDV